MYGIVPEEFPTKLQGEDSRNLKLQCIYKKYGTVLYGSAPMSGARVVLDESGNCDSGVIYDLMGRRAERVVPGSVYVRDGRKFVGK